MRHNNSRRSRGRNNNNNRRSNNPKSQTFDSNGPEVRIRGNAVQIVEKYTTLARDASSSGDNILAESYYQHAEHYQRIINEFSAANERNNDRDNDKNDNSSNDKKEAVSENKKSENDADNNEKAAKPKRAPRAKKPLTLSLIHI